MKYLNPQCAECLRELVDNFKYKGTKDAVAVSTLDYNEDAGILTVQYLWHREICDGHCRKEKNDTH